MKTETACVFILLLLLLIMNSLPAAADFLRMFLEMIFVRILSVWIVSCFFIRKE